MPLGFYSEKQVVELTTFSRTTIWRRVKDGSFPKPIQISVGRKAWARTALEKWLEDQQGESFHAG